MPVAIARVLILSLFISELFCEKRELPNKQGIDMRKILVVLALTLIASAASAADMPARAPVYKAAPAPAISWTGGYVGIQGGGAWYHGDIDSTAGGPLAPGPSVKDSGGTFGATIGYNWQNGLWVVGVEGDWSWTDLRASNLGAANCSPNACQIKTDWFATARARIGYTLTPNTLLYATGGAAFTHVKDSMPGLGLSISDTKAGWTAGGGVEAMLTQNWTVKAEYLYIDIANGPDLFTGVLTTERPRNQDLQVVRAGLNYKF